MMEAVFPQDMLQAVLKDSAEIDNATANLMTVYELTGAGHPHRNPPPLPRLPGRRRPRGRDR